MQVGEGAVDEDRVAPGPFTHKAGALIAADGGVVVDGDLEFDAMQAQVLEGMTTHHVEGGAADAVAATTDITNDEAQRRVAVAPVDAVQAAGADEDAGFDSADVVDGEDDLDGGAHEGLVPALVLGHGGRVAPQQAPLDVVVVQPPQHGGEIGALEATQARHVG